MWQALSAPFLPELATCPGNHLLTCLEATFRLSLKWLLGRTEIWPQSHSVCLCVCLCLSVSVSASACVSAHALSQIHWKVLPNRAVQTLDSRGQRRTRTSNIYMRIAKGIRLDSYSIYIPLKKRNGHFREYFLCEDRLNSCMFMYTLSNRIAWV